MKRVRIETSKTKKYNNGPNSGWSGVSHKLELDGVSINVVQTINSDLFGVSYASTCIVDGLCESVALKVGERVLTSGAETIDEMRIAAREYLDGMA